MTLPALELLRCPDCRSSLEEGRDAGNPIRCPSCGRAFPLYAGVLDIVPSDVDSLTRETVQQFGASWKAHDFLAPYQERQFLDWISPMGAEAFKDAVVVEAGCGKGRHTFLMAGYGVKSVLSVDLSDAVLLAAEYTKAFPWVHCLRADLLDLPLQDASADVAVCLGVLHHLKDPEEGLRGLWRVLKPGGTLCLWVYAREGNGWVVALVDPVRKLLTSRIPTHMLRPLLLPLSLFLYALLKLVYGPATRRGSRPVGWLPYSAYLGYISGFPFREIEHIVLDHLCPPIANYLPKNTLEAWITALGGSIEALRWHNRNSWTLIARKPRP